ncbi:MAG: hypothetical protein AAGI46_16000 [Planctomycetota bacterium]
MTSDARPTGFTPGRVALASVGAWLVVLIVGGAWLAIDASQPGNPLSASRATFHATSIATLTGFRVSWAPTSLAAGLMTLAATSATWCFLAATLCQLVNARVSSLLVALNVGVPWAAAALLLFAVEDPSVAVAVVGSSGFVTETAQLSTILVWFLVLPAGLVGPLVPLLLTTLLTRRSDRQTVDQSPPAQPVGLNRQLSWTLFATALLLLVTLPTSVLFDRSVLTLDLLGAGLLDSADGLGTTRRWVIVPLLLVSAVGPTMLLLVIVGIISMLRSRTSTVAGIAMIGVVSMVALFAATFIALTATNPQVSDATNAHLAAAAVATNAGSFTLPTIAGTEAWVLSGAMLAGHALPLAILWWAATRRGATVVPY